ncbi:RidA family protein [Rhodopseudomonas sp. P2A-2r]|uniref:RidA family protein n=1 Tax=unclassified Rhodopseudomonas TaxID=2638247 RepID=UPI0022343DA5|nr:RidA family protein [Rhodopseudomonas sp. P2A-2r]UZE50697.1 RidA family protein [Rhodopseudomonas sp. P2A-2r]
MLKNLKNMVLNVGVLFLISGATAAQAENTFSNPPAIAKGPGYTHVVEVSGPHRLIFIAGQLGVKPDGKFAGEPGDFKAQATQAYQNLKAALDSVGASFKDVIKVNHYMTDIRAQLPVLREVRDTFVNTAAPPASTTVEVSRLAADAALFEVEAVVALPPR